jgi:2-keto-4-pentenoate hydratase/2-oxohepta-3-ene-1,7-dioic acid hydratase in catechol pathway
MKIARCTDGGAPFWAVVDTSRSEVTPISGAFFRVGARADRGAGAAALKLADAPRPLDGVRLLPPIEKTNRVVVAGANYAKHLQSDFGLKSHSQPVAFKAYGALIGAGDPIRYPPLTAELDHEVELVAVIGAERVDRDDPLSSTGLHGRQ